MIERLELADLLEINADLCADTGENSVCLDRAGLDAAVERPWSGLGDEEFYPTLYDKAAALLHGVASRQVFENGNKRTAWAAAAAFLDINGVDIGSVEPVQSDMFVRAAALDHTLEISDLAEWFAVSHRAAAAPLMPTAVLAVHGTTYENVSVKVRDVAPANRPSILDGVTFRDCEITGPGVLIILDGSTFVGNQLSSQSLWELQTGRTYEGGVGVSNCTFEGCHFVGVGIAGPRDVIDSFFS